MSAPVGFLELLTDDERRELDAIGIPRRAPRGRAILAERQIADQVVLVRAGHVKIVASTGQGTDVVLGFCGPGALLGEQSVIDGAPRAAGVVAVEDVELLAVPASAFRTFLATHPHVTLALVAMLSARLREADSRLAQFASSDALGRVAARLLELCEGYGTRYPGGDVRITLPLSQEDLAGWTGCSLEATARALRQLRGLRLISTARRSIVVHDLDALRTHAA